ncbi:MAG TPA: hypothetical protein VFQ13_15670 [Anaerolineales bacterium]|nr:hypothetical protein [Anaerolineales bacterium]
MKTKWFILALCTVLLAACAPSTNAVNTAIAQTEEVVKLIQAAIPTATLTPRPTKTPKPTRTQRPTSTPGDDEFTELFPDLMLEFTTSQLGGKIEVIDIEYGGSPSPTTLTVRFTGAKAGYTSPEAMAMTLGVLSQTTKSAPDWFPISLETLVLREYDGLVQRGRFTVTWKDFLEYAGGKIDVNQLILRGRLLIN